MNPLLLQALKGINKERIPYWLMRQAGRYIPKYQELKEKWGMQKMFSTPDLIVEVTLLPLPLLKVDAAILFADIMTVVEGLGLTWEVVEGVGPLVFNCPQDFVKLSLQDPEKAYHFIAQSIQALKKELNCPLIGFVGAPFTVASFLIEGKVSKDLGKVKKMLYQAPEKLHQLLEKITEASCAYLEVQIQNGVDVVQIFDSLAHHLSYDAFTQFSYPYIQRIIDKIHAHNLPVILFCRGSGALMPQLIKLQPEALSLDWQTAIDQPIPTSIALQGNLDPHLLWGTQKRIKEEVDILLHKVKKSPRYIFNLGHGILPGTPLENVQFLCDYVRSSTQIS